MGLSLVVAAVAAVPLKFQQLVINSLVYGGDRHRVAWLCAGLLGAVLLSAALKFALNMRLAVVGERVVRLMRERLYANHVADATTGAADTPKRGTLVTMLSAEAEAVGSFAGAAITSRCCSLGRWSASSPSSSPVNPGSGYWHSASSFRKRGSSRPFKAGSIDRSERVQSLRDASDRISESDLTRVEEEILADFRISSRQSEGFYSSSSPRNLRLARSVRLAWPESCFWAARWFWTAAVT